MAEKIFNYPDNTLGFVSESKLHKGDTVIIGVDEKFKDIFGVVKDVIEQRPEKGTYTDESKRRVWQRVSIN